MNLLHLGTYGSRCPFRYGFIIQQSLITAQSEVGMPVLSPSDSLGAFGSAKGLPTVRRGSLTCWRIRRKYVPHYLDEIHISFDATQYVYPIFAVD
jgi:hypothetical protein